MIPTAAPYIAMTIAEDTIVRTVEADSVIVDGSGGTVMFVPQPGMSPHDRSRIYSQWVDALQDAREAVLNEMSEAEA